MERRISTSFTEFYKVYGILCVAMFFALFGFHFFDSPVFPFPFFPLLFISINIIFTVNFWRMKEVEMSDAGLIISRRMFFNQETIFVPYENIESVKRKLWWLGNSRQVSIKFTEKTDFGNEVTFISRGFTRMSQLEIVEELNRTVIRNKTSDKINAAFNQLED